MKYYLLCIKDSKVHSINSAKVSDYKSGMVYEVLSRGDFHVDAIIDNRISIISINDIFYEFFKIVNISEVRRLKLLQINK